VQKSQILGLFRDANLEGFTWDKLPSTAASAPTTNAASARSATSRRSPDAQAQDPLPCSRKGFRRRGRPPRTQKSDGLGAAARDRGHPGQRAFPLGSVDPGPGADPGRPTWLVGQGASPERAELRVVDLDWQAHADDHGGASRVRANLTRDRVKSGLAAARARGIEFGRQFDPAIVRQEG
jgi:hypothetical protein